MLWFRKKQIVSEHTHIYSKILGEYYKLHRTEYRNCFDIVKVYQRQQCECGAYRDVCMSSNNFLPSLYNLNSDANTFINGLKREGIKEEYKINLETNMISCRIN